jgi:hypothetical protein
MPLAESLDDSRLEEGKWRRVIPRRTHSRGAHYVTIYTTDYVWERLTRDCVRGPKTIENCILDGGGETGCSRPIAQRLGLG